MYENLSNFAEGVDTAFVIILSIILFFLVGLTVTLIIFIIKYREKKNPIPTPTKDNILLELTWTIIPIVLVIGMFHYGWIAFKPMVSKAPENSMVVKTDAFMWDWRFEYKNGRKTDTLYVPQGDPVKLELYALDVIHSFYIPAFRIKQDIVPGTPSSLWFIANAPGVYDIFCAEYCGLEHSYMYTAVKVLPKEEFEKWYTDTTQVVVVSDKPGMAGFQIMKDNGCFACHSTDGSKLVGPTYKGIFGHEVEVIRNGVRQTVTVDKEYITRSIYYPDEEVVAGYNKGLMRHYQGQITEEEIDKIVEYLETLGGE